VYLAAEAADRGHEHQRDEEHQTRSGDDAERVADQPLAVIARADRQDPGRHHRGENIG
jgi:hypothetical protein